MRVTELHIYPIKSCQGIRLNSLAIDQEGPVWDRRLVLLDSTGTFISQRKFPQLAQIRCSLVGDQLELSSAQGTIRIAIAAAGSTTIQAKIWNDTVQTREADPAVSRWFSDFLGHSCTLAIMAPEFKRPLNPKYDLTGQRSVNFADGYPFLLTNEASLADLGATAPIPMSRFRPNIVIAGADPFAEEGWTRLVINHIEFIVAKPCTRCVVTNVDQTSGSVDPRGQAVFERLIKHRKKAVFGLNLMHTGAGTIEVGAPVQIIH